jgi:hypothetical protein
VYDSGAIGRDVTPFFSSRCAGSENQTDRSVIGYHETDEFALAQGGRFDSPVHSVVPSHQKFKQLGRSGDLWANKVRLKNANPSV